MGGNANARITDAEFEVRIDSLQQHLHLTTLRRELDRVGQQTPHHLLQTRAVGADDVLTGTHDCRQTNAFDFCRWRGGIHRGLDDARERDLMQVQPELAGHDPAQVQKIVDQLDLRAGVTVDDFDGALLLLRVPGRTAFEKHLCPAENRAERGTQLVRQGRQEFVLQPGCALRGHSRAALRIQHVFTFLIGGLYGLDAFALRQVAGEFGVAKQSSEDITQGRDRDIGPERRPVLAQTPSGIDKAALLRRDLQLVVGPSAVSRVLRIKARKVSAENLACGVALDPLSADVPGGHPTVRIEHEIAYSLTPSMSNRKRSSLRRSSSS
jgi:hypothetical protein